MNLSVLNRILWYFGASFGVFMVELFNEHKAVSAKKFNIYIKHKKMEYSEGQDLTKGTIMKMAANESKCLSEQGNATAHPKGDVDIDRQIGICNQEKKGDWNKKFIPTFECKKEETCKKNHQMTDYGNEYEDLTLLHITHQ